MLKIISFFSILSLSLTSQAELTLDDLSSHLHKNKNSSGLFEQQKYMSILNKPLQSSGIFAYSKQGYMYWNTIKPVNSVICQGTDTSPSTNNFSEWTSHIFSGDFAQLSKTFNIKAEGNLTSWTIRMAPASATIQKILKEVIVTGKESITGVNIWENNGDRVEISLVSQSLNPEFREKIGSCFELVN